MEMIESHTVYPTMIQDRHRPASQCTRTIEGMRMIENQSPLPASLVVKMTYHLLPGHRRLAQVRSAPLAWAWACHLQQAQQLVRLLVLELLERHPLGLVADLLPEATLADVAVEDLAVILRPEVEASVVDSVVEEEAVHLQAQVLDEETQASHVLSQLTASLTQALAVAHHHLDPVAPSLKRQHLPFDRPATLRQLHTHAPSVLLMAKPFRMLLQAPRQPAVQPNPPSPRHPSTALIQRSPTCRKSSRAARKPNQWSTARSSISWRTRPRNCGGR